MLEAALVPIGALPCKLVVVAEHDIVGIVEEVFKEPIL